MRRKTFIKNISLATAALYLSPSILTSCRKDDNKKVNWDGKVIIIGAGVAGLEAAKKLSEAGVKFITILEADNRWGGRVKSLTGFADFPVELGAEEIHGENSDFKKMFDKQGKSLIDSYDSEDYFYYKGNLISGTDISSDTDFKKAKKIADDIADYNGADISVLQHITNNNVFQPELIAYLNAILGNENGTDIGKIGMEGLALNDNLWSAGEKNFVAQNASIYEVLASNYLNQLSLISYEKQVNSINHAGEQIEVKTTNNDIYLADKVIIAVPLSVLKKNVISFSPALPQNKLNAIQQIGFDAGMKIIIKFSQRFWAEDTGSIYGEGYVPEFWATGAGKGTNNVLTAFVMGENAAYLSSLGSNAIQEVLMQLNAMYGNNVATTNYQSHYIIDWYKEPFIEGAYSFPKVGATGAFLNLSLPVNDKLFFAGEATHSGGHNATVHGAIETGQRVAEEIINSIS